MPSISEHWALIDAIILGGEQDMFSVVEEELGQGNSDYEMGSPQLLSTSGSESGSSTSSFSTSSSEDSSACSLLLSRSVDMDEEHARTMAGTADLLQATLETRVLNPHEVPKCSQLHLVLVDFKASDPKRFRQNLRVSPSTFDSLLKMIEGHSVFTNNSYTVQIPVCKQLAITLFCLGHDTMAMQHPFFQLRSGQG